MIRLRFFLLSITAILFCLTVQAQGTKEGSVTEKVNESQTISLGSTYSRVLQYNATGVNYRWYSTNTSVATVSYSSFKSCTVKGKVEGSCKVCFTASFYIDGYYRTYDFYWDVTVSGYTSGGGGTTTTIDPTSVEVYPTELTLEVGQTYDMSFDVSPGNANYTYDWANYNTSLVSLTQSGKVTALSPGKAKIAVRIYKIGYSLWSYVEYCNITVVPASRVLEENSTEALSSVENCNVTVTRTLTANKWSTICLPFAMNEEQTKAAFGDEVEIADFTGYEAEKDGDGNVVGLKVNFNSVEAMEANHPYIIKPHNNVSQFTIDGVDVVPTDDAKVVYDNVLTGGYGSFVGTYVADTEVPDKCLFISDNKFWYSSGNTKMKAYRAYFDLRDVLTDAGSGHANSRIRIALNNEATGIEENLPLDIKDNKWYDLFGRQVNRAAKGVYIRNGKKYVNK